MGAVRVMPIQERSMMSEQIEDSGTGYGGPRMDAAARQQLMFKLARTEPTPGAGAAAPARPAPGVESGDTGVGGSSTKYEAREHILIRGCLAEPRRRQ
jgi:hypothetical protein